jgi:hypothetical protein
MSFAVDPPQPVVLSESDAIVADSVRRWFRGPLAMVASWPKLQCVRAAARPDVWDCLPNPSDLREVAV